MNIIDTLVAGAGVIGLACADALARAGREVVVVESESLYGSGVSARNSEVIHSGVYYTPGTRKARLCVPGRRLLYEFCERHGVPHRRCGKLIVATREDQRPELEKLHARGEANGVESLRLIDGAEARAMEPQLDAVAALWSPATGIVDSHALMTALLGRAAQHGATLVLQTRFASATPRPGGRFEVVLDDDQRVAEVPQPNQRVDQSPVVPLVQTDGRFVEDVQHADQSAADLPGKADSLRFAAGECRGRPFEREIVEAYIG